MKRLAVLAVFFLAPCAWALDGAGSTSASFLKIGIGPRQVAMGEAFVGLADDVHAMYYNPAGLGMLRRQEVALMHNSYFDGVTQQVGSYAFPTQNFGTIGMGFNIVKVEEFQAFDKLDQPVGTVDAEDSAASVTYSREIGSLRRVSIGGTMRYVRSRLDSYTASATMFDAGVLARYGLEGPYETRYRLGAALKNIGEEQKFIEESFKLPQSLHVGATRCAPLPHPFEDMRVNLVLEVIAPIDKNPYTAIGTEVYIIREFAIRLGYRSNQDEGFGLSVGFGFISMHRGFLPKWVPEVTMDYALVDYGNLEQAHRIGFSMKFGRDKLKKDEFDSLFDLEE